MTARVPPVNLTYATKEEMATVNKLKGRLLADDEPGSIGKALEFAAGTTYAGVVRSCLCAGNREIDNDSGDSSDEDEDIDPGDACIDLELKMLGQLKRCRSH